MTRLNSILELYLSILNLKDIVFELDHNLTMIIQGIWRKRSSSISGYNYLSPANSFQLLLPLLLCWQFYPASHLLMFGNKIWFFGAKSGSKRSSPCVYPWLNQEMELPLTALLWFAFLNFSHMHERVINHMNSFLIGKISFKMWCIALL